MFTQLPRPSSLRSPHVIVVAVALVAVLGLMVNGPLQSTLSAQAGPAPTLGIQDVRFTVNNTPKFLLFISYFGALVPLTGEDGNALRARITQQFRVAKQYGFDGVRIFPNWQPNHCGALTTPVNAFSVMNGDGTIKPDLGQRFLDVLDIAYSEGLLVDVSWHMESVVGLDPYEYGAALQLITGYIRGTRPHVYFDLENEHNLYAPDPGNGCAKPAWAPAVIRQLRDAVKDPILGDPNRIVSASYTEINDYGAMVDDAIIGGFDFLAHHNLRDYDPGGLLGYCPEPYVPCRTRQRTHTGAQVNADIAAMNARGWRRPIHLQEPERWTERTPCYFNCATRAQDFVDMARLAKQAGAAAWTFHNEELFNINQVQPWFSQEEYNFLLRLIPDVVNYPFWGQW